MTTGTNFSSAFDGEGEGGSGSPGGSVYEEEWEGGDEGDEYVKRYGGGRRGKKDEPMSPLAVVCKFEESFLVVGAFQSAGGEHPAQVGHGPYRSAEWGSVEGPEAENISKDWTV